MADEKIIKEKKVRQEPDTVAERRTVMEPRTVMEKKTVEVPKTVMEERTVEEKKTVMREHEYESWVAATCDKITDMAVVDAQGEKLGSISDIMIDLDSGRILYAVMSFGGMFNKKLFAIPWEAFTVANRESYYEEDQENHLILNIPRSKFEESEGFDKDNWPRQPDRTWLSDTYSRYGYKGWWDEEDANSDVDEEEPGRQTG